mgnify:CR=1 FL=1
MSSFAEYIAEALENSGRPLKEIAERIHVHSSYLSRIKKGAIPSLLVLEGLIRELNLDREKTYRLYHQALEERARRTTERGLKRWELAAPALVEMSGSRISGIGMGDVMESALIGRLLMEEAEEFFADEENRRAAAKLLGKEELSTREKCILYQAIRLLKGLKKEDEKTGE